MATGKSMKIAKTKVRGEVRWVVNLGKIGGKRKRVYAESEAAARRVARDAVAQRRSAGDVWVGLSDDARLEVVTILAKCRERGVSLSDVWQGYVNGTTGPAKLAPFTLAQAIELTKNAKEAQNCRPRYVKELGKYLRSFARGREQMPVASVTLATIQEWFASRRETPKRIVGSVGVLSSMFSTCVDAGYLHVNPCHKFKRPRIDYGRPAIFTPAQVRLAVDHVHQFHPRHLGWFALATFAGIRPEEIGKLSWAQFDKDRKTITLDPEHSKVRTRRIVHLEPAALAWALEAKRIACPFEFDEREKTKVRKSVCAALGIEQWPQDVLRHSAASYWLAHAKDAGKVAMELGTSEGVLLKHYRELVHDEQAAAFWAIMPQLRIP